MTDEHTEMPEPPFKDDWTRSLVQVLLWALSWLISLILRLANDNDSANGWLVRYLIKGRNDRNPEGS